ncbi:MAG: tRNA (adenosine(37)-N6)-threonylcarbamoyltransferase complex transferase subunit TsaD [Candidatus Omnitrophota bacterium]
MRVLGIETSCDETSAAIVKDGRDILSNVVSSSIKFHAKYGGVIPEIASRMQLETITQVVDSAVEEAGIKLKDIGLVSVTAGPGLPGSLLVGTSFAKAIAFSLGAPLLAVDHIYAHIYASALDRKPIQLPFIALIVSGGHTSLFLVKDFDNIKTLGATQDDACGEAFDKIAKLLGLGYPGGPLIEQLAKKGNPKKIKFRCSGTHGQLDFSFSGIKTAVLYRVKAEKTLSRQTVCDIAASFQEAVTDTLVEKSLLACRMKKINRLVIGGGVAANSYLREKFSLHAQSRKVSLHFPSRQLCMDNAAMVAGLGFQLFKRGHKSELDF